jgi:lipoprotein-anchoring transpeptidase ErfK/SrfK
MKRFDTLARRLLLLAALVVSGCAGQPRTPPKPPAPTAPPIASYGGPRRVVVSLGEQMLRAYDGQQLVFETRVSTGREGKRTPTGSFRALDRELIHYSSLYENSPMPYSVRFHGNFFLHGFSIVPHYRASHGCIRLPLREGDLLTARQFYEWVRIGTPIRVTGR